MAAFTGLGNSQSLDSALPVAALRADRSSVSLAALWNDANAKLSRRMSCSSSISYARSTESWARQRSCILARYAAQARGGDDQKKAGTRLHEDEHAARDSQGLERLEYDVVIVGAGIIGLSIASRLLSDTNFSVAVVDAARPCAGATGAGQGYIWLGHRPPGTVSWPLAVRSKQLWEEFVKGLQASGLDPLTAIGYKNTGSLLFGSTPEQALALRERVEALCKEGLQAEYLEATLVTKAEPELKVGPEGSAALIFDDSQIDALLAASYIAGENRGFSASGRFKELYYDPVVSFLWSGQDGCIAGVQTSRRLVYCKETVIMAAGAWSGVLMENAFKKFSLPLVLPTRPRKGHLLVLEGLAQLQLRHALMEFEYVSHQGPPGEDAGLAAVSSATGSDAYGIATTATMDAEGRLLLGSSRQFIGFDYSLEDEVMEYILQSATKFLPVLGNTKALRRRTARIGHRPYVPDGRPMIGRIPGLEGILLATGHEGAGLCLALGTAEMVVNLMVNKVNAVDPLPFSPAGRLVPPDSNKPPVHQW